MFFYMFGLDNTRPEACAKQLAKLGIDAVVGVSDRRSIDAIRENGMRAYACTDAFPLNPGDRKCIDVDAVERVWFSSRCPNDENANRRREEAWFNLARTEGLSGVFLDGARFASPASAEGTEGLFTCFCPDCTAKMEAAGLNPEQVRRGVREWRDGQRNLPPREWLAFRESTVASAMARFSNAIRSAGAELQTGAFVFSASLGALVGQTLSVCDTIDIVAPMLYRRYDEPEGPATLNHEYHALVRSIGISRTHALTGVTPPPEVLKNGFAPEHLAEEVQQVALRSNQMLAPILQLRDERLAESIAAIQNGGAQGAGFFMYAPEALHFLPRLIRG